MPKPNKNSDTVVRLRISVGLTVDPVVHEIKEACEELRWVIIKDEEQQVELYTAKLCSNQTDFGRPPKYWAIATVTVAAVSGKGWLEISQNAARGGIERPYKDICDAIRSRLERAGLYQPPPPEAPKRPLGFLK